MEYKVEVKAWMTKPSSEGFDFMKSWNNDIPMPLRVMYGVKLGETKGMVKMSLHGDLKDKVTQCCMMCGRPITNAVSKYFGLGPICGEHNYTNPFDTEEELAKAVEDFRIKLVNMTWTGWIAKSAILTINDDTDVASQLVDMPIVVTDTIAESSKRSVNAVVKVEVNKPNRCTEDYSAFVSFKYDANLVSYIKNLPQRFWHSENKTWELPYSELQTLMSKYTSFDYDVDTKVEIKEHKAKLPVGFSYKTVPYPHQEEGVLYGMGKSRWLLADSQGLGKTKTLIDLAIARKLSDGIKHCLIVCGVNSLKWNWVKEIGIHSYESCRILGQHITRKGKVVVKSNAAKLSDIKNLEYIPEFFIVTNVESLRDADIAEALGDACDSGIIGMVAIDEIHRCKSLSSLQGSGMLHLAPFYRVAMTGTPLLNSPLDLYAIMKWLGHQPYNYGAFKNYFCLCDGYGSVVGYKNLDQLTNQLSSIMLRRTKEEVLNLPDKVYSTEYVELTSEQTRAYNSVINNAIDVYKNGEKITVSNVLSQIMRLRQVTGGCSIFNNIKHNAKLDRIEQIVEEAVYSGSKVVIFSNWQDMVDVIMKRLNKYHPLTITGSTKDSDRMDIVNSFQTKDTYKVIVGTIGAMGTGLTLTAGTEVIFADEPWTNSDKEQAIDRCHRIGTKNTVNVHTILAHNSIDTWINDIVISKGGLSNTVVDSGNGHEYPAIIKSFITDILGQRVEEVG